MSTQFKSDENAINAIVEDLMKIETLSLQERINNNIVDLFNYNKHDGNKGRMTGKALLLNQVPNLTVIDIITECQNSVQHVQCVQDISNVKFFGGTRQNGTRQIYLKFYI